MRMTLDIQWGQKADAKGGFFSESVIRFSNLQNKKFENLKNTSHFLKKSHL